MLSECYGLIRTEMIRPPSSFEIVRNRKVLNVDLNTPDAVANTRRDGLVDRELADVVCRNCAIRERGTYSAVFIFWG